MHIPSQYAVKTKNIIATIALYSALALIPISAVAQMPMPSSQPGASQSAQGKQQVWSGQISTRMCKKIGTAMGHDCILNCVKAGEKLVLFTKGQVFEISNQDFGDLKVHAGSRVKLTGSLETGGKTITVTKIEMADHGKM